MNQEEKETDWQRWVREHTPRFLLFARQKARSEADAHDLVQEAVVEALQRSHGEPPPAGLVFATIHRRAIDWARREDRRTQREEHAADSSVSWFDTAVEDRELSQIVENAMRRLPEMYREVIALKLWGGMTFAEIGGALNAPANTVASRYRYGIAELRKITKGVLT